VRAQRCAVRSLTPNRRAFPGLETFLDGPAGAGDQDEFTDGFVTRVVAVVVSEFAVVDGPADQVLVIGVVAVGDRPVIDAVAFRADSREVVATGVDEVGSEGVSRAGVLMGPAGS